MATVSADLEDGHVTPEHANCSSPRKGNYVKHQTRRLGSAADARRVDSRRNISLRGNVRARVHEDIVPAAKSGPFAAAKVHCERLASGEKLTTAALDAGYNSTSAFISMFRKQLGKTPARYLEAGPNK
jgi:AraC-like DNA-binding protein